MKYGELNDQKLLINYMNLVTTRMACHGHNKAYQNEVSGNAVRNIMADRGLPIPDDSFCAKYGIFNGEGAK